MDLKMISCIILAMGFAVLIWSRGLITGKPKTSKDFSLGLMAGLGFAVIVFAITAICTSRTYNTERFSLSIPANECQIRESKGNTIVTYNSNTYLLSSKNVVVYDAPDKASEQVEIYGEKRTYSIGSMPSLLYELYYMHKPYDETTIVTISINRSVYKAE
jgi:hypothetical protein